MKTDGLCDHTIECHSHMLFNSIQKAVGSMHIEDLKKIDSAKVKMWGSQQGITGDYRAVITYRRLLCFITDSGYPLNFDWRNIEIPKQILKDVVSLDNDEIAIIREELSTSGNQYWAQRRHFSNLRTRAMFELGLHTGLRLGEIIQLNVDDLDLQKEKVEYVNIKTGKPRRKSMVGATKYLQEYIAARNDENPALFITTGPFGRPTKDAERLTRIGVKSHLRKLKKRLKDRGLRKNFHFHLLRKTYVTRLLREKVDLKSVQWLADHASERTTLRYYASVNHEYAEAENDRVMEGF